MKLQAFLALLFISPCCGKWIIHIDKNISQITGSRNANVQVKAKKGKAFVILGCNDSKPIFRIAENFQFENGMYDGLTKSKLETAVNKGPQYERMGFRLAARDGAFYSKIKFRPSGVSKFIEAEPPAGYDNHVYFLVLDALADIGSLLSSELLYAQLPYKSGDKIVEFPLSGLSDALDALAQAGCKLR